MNENPNRKKNNTGDNEEEYFEDCLMCNSIDCFRLKDFQEDNPEIGRELHFGELLFKKIHYENDEELADIICKNNHFFQALCFFVNTISETEQNLILRDSLFQSARDLKVSIYLAMTANYRNAMQVLRCSYETLLFCLYYMLDLKQAKDVKDKERVIKEYNNYISGGVVKRPDIFTEIFRRLGFISREEEKEWKRLYSDLSKYIHTPKSSWGKKVKEPELEVDLSCIANNIFDLSHLKLWSEHFRKVLYIIVKIGLYFEPLKQFKKSDSGKLAFNKIKGEIDTYFKHRPEEMNNDNILVKLRKIIGF